MKKLLLFVILLLSLFALTACCLVHSWSPATCTAPEQCIKCGKTRTAPLGHSWEEATCLSPVTCSRCFQTEDIPLGHELVTPACEVSSTCQRCGIEVEPQGHAFMPATKLRASYCENCELTIGEPLNVPWYVGLNMLSKLSQTDIFQKGISISLENPCLNADEIEYTINQEGAQIIYDNGSRALLLGNSMLYLCTRTDRKALIQAAIRTDDMLHVESVHAKGIERAMTYGNGVRDFRDASFDKTNQSYCVLSLPLAMSYLFFTFLS